MIVKGGQDVRRDPQNSAVDSYAGERAVSNPQPNGVRGNTQVLCDVVNSEHFVVCHRRD